jgi:hypothetical protein
MANLRNYEEDLLGFLVSLGLYRRAARELVTTLVEFADVCECLKEMAERAEANGKRPPINTHLD